MLMGENRSDNYQIIQLLLKENIVNGFADTFLIPLTLKQHKIFCKFQNTFQGIMDQPRSNFKDKQGFVIVIEGSCDLHLSMLETWISKIQEEADSEDSIIFVIINASSASDAQQNKLLKIKNKIINQHKQDCRYCKQLICGKFIFA